MQAMSEHNAGAKQRILLCSSNATKEYILDVLEAIAVPRGFIIHFRYEKKWVSEDLWQRLPVKGQNHDDLKGAEVLVLYVIQERDNGTRTWKSIYPLRFGSLLECYRTGDGDNDIAHFYFETRDYCDSGNLEYIRPQLLSKFGKGDDSSAKYFAAFSGETGNDAIMKKCPWDESAFNSLVRNFKLEHFRSDDSRKQYYPVFLFVRGLLNPSLQKTRGDILQMCYEVVERKSYVFEASLRFLESPDPCSRVTIDSPEEQIAMLPRAENAIASRYDEFKWNIIMPRVVKNVETAIILSTKVCPPRDDCEVCEVLDLTLPIPLVIKFDWRVRLIEVVGDISLALSATAIGMLGIIEKFLPDGVRNWGSWVLGFVVVLFCLGTLIKAYLQWEGK